MAPPFIRSEPSGLNHLSELPLLCQRLATQRSTVGAALLQCQEFLPPDADFPDSSTKFHEPRVVEFVKPAHRTQASTIGPVPEPYKFRRFLDKEPKPVYQKPAPAHTDRNLGHRGFERAIDKVLMSNCRQTRFIVEEKLHDGLDDLLKAAAPLDQYEAATLSLTTPKRIVSMKKTVIGASRGDWGLGRYSLKVAGASTIYVVIAPDHADAFEDISRWKFNPRGSKRECHQFIQHLSPFTGLSYMGDTIKYSLMQQRVGDVAVFLPGVYYYGIEMGASYSIEMSWAPEGWNPESLGLRECCEGCGARPGDRVPMPQKRVPQPKPQINIPLADIEPPAGTSAVQPRIRAPSTRGRASKRRQTEDTLSGAREPAMKLEDRDMEDGLSTVGEAETVLQQGDAHGEDRAAKRRRTEDTLNGALVNSEACDMKDGLSNVEEAETVLRQEGDGDGDCAGEEAVRRVIQRARDGGDAQERAFAGMLETAWTQLREIQGRRDG